MRTGTVFTPRAMRPALFATLALVGAGCANLGTPPPEIRAAPSVPSAAFDGRYVGTIRTAGGSVSMNRVDCETTPRFAFAVLDGRFTVPLPHPRAAGTPSLEAKATPTYDAIITADGTVRGFSLQTNTDLLGQVVGTRMTGQINGLLCYYDFTVERS